MEHVNSSFALSADCLYRFTFSSACPPAARRFGAMFARKSVHVAKSRTWFRGFAMAASEADRLFGIIDTNQNKKIEDSELPTYLLAQGQEEEVIRSPRPTARRAPRAFPPFE